MIEHLLRVLEKLSILHSTNCNQGAANGFFAIRGTPDSVSETCSDLEIPWSKD